MICSRKAGLASECGDLFRHAADLGLNVGVIAAIVLAEILGGPLRKRLSTKARAAVRGLQNYARRATEVLREIARRGITLAGVTSDTIAREVFRPESVHEVSEVIERIARIPDLLDHLQDCARRSVESLKNASSKQAGATP